LALTSAPFRAVPLATARPSSDDERLLEHVSSAGVTLKSSSALAAHLAAVREPVVLCGHSHLPHAVALPDGRLIVNPGSVGLPAYSDQTPVPHTMETGSPHARYAIIAEVGTGWRVEHVVVPYDWESASRAAARNGREDWAAWLRTGRANLTR
jgi:diadenosine tetraphosphatase ApaH/serine/threonine PP2A family protein phosphatase